MHAWQNQPAPDYVACGNRSDAILSSLKRRQTIQHTNSRISGWRGSGRSYPSADYAKAEAEIRALCQNFVKTKPEIRALVFECTGFQPFARAVQRDLDLPIFSWSTLLEFAYSVTNHRDFYGHV